ASMSFNAMHRRLSLAALSSLACIGSRVAFAVAVTVLSTRVVSLGCDDAGLDCPAVFSRAGFGAASVPHASWVLRATTSARRGGAVVRDRKVKDSDINDPLLHCAISILRVHPIAKLKP